MLDPSEEEGPRGRVDAAAVLYILFGVPGIVGFIAVLFAAARACDLPA